MKKAVADWLRKWADRLDLAGAPKRTGWSFTFEEGWGTVFNQDGRGCPLWYYGNEDFQLAHDAAAPSADPCCEIKWVAVGSLTPDGVSVLGSAEVTSASFTRRMNGYDEVDVGQRRPAKVPRWRVTLRCDMDSWVSLPGKTFREAVEGMFGRSGIRG